MGETTSEIRYDIERTREQMAGTIHAIGYKFDLSARARYRFAHIVGDVSDRLSGVGDTIGGTFGEATSTIGDTFADAKDAVEDAFDGTPAGARDFIASTVGQARAAVDSSGDVASTVGNRVHGVIGTMQSEISDVKETVFDTVTSQTTPMVETAKSQGRAVSSFAHENGLLVGVGAFAAGLIGGLFIPRTRIEQERVTPIASRATHKAMEVGEGALDRGMEMAKEAIEDLTSPAQKDQGQPQAEVQVSSVG